MATTFFKLNHHSNCFELLYSTQSEQKLRDKKGFSQLFVKLKEVAI